jgi:C-terminal peptidase prc
MSDAQPDIAAPHATRVVPPGDSDTPTASTTPSAPPPSPQASTTPGATHTTRGIHPAHDSATASASSTPPPTATQPASRPTATTLSEAQRQQIFEKVWHTINENYLYADFGGLDWENVWVEFAPRVRTTTSNEDFYALMTDMVGRLGDQHSRFLAPHDAVAEHALSVGHEAHVGIGVITAPTSEGAVVQHVFAGSPAAQAGLRIRDRIIAVDGRPFAAGRDITGMPGSEVRLTVVRPDGATWEVVLTRQPVEGNITPTVRRLPGDIGYIHISTLWISDMADQVSGGLTDLVVERPLDGLILDLRGNPGGWREVLTSVLSHFVQGNVGSFYGRNHTRALQIHESSGPDLRGLPLVVLVDQHTASYAEVLAAVLQAEADAYVIGTLTSGNTETIYAYELSDGARLWVAQEGFQLRDGTNLEGNGLRPNLEIDVDWTLYSEAKDPHILAALEYLHE